MGARGSSRRRAEHSSLARAKPGWFGWLVRSTADRAARARGQDGWPQKVSRAGFAGSRQRTISDREPEPPPGAGLVIAHQWIPRTRIPRARTTGSESPQRRSPDSESGFRPGSSFVASSKARRQALLRRLGQLSIRQPVGRPRPSPGPRPAGVPPERRPEPLSPAGAVLPSGRSWECGPVTFCPLKKRDRRSDSIAGQR